MTPHELLAIIDKHDRWLARRTGGARACLAMADLRGMYLARTNLRKIKLAGAILTNCDLKQSDLSEADLFAADLIAADLTGCNLERADLRGAHLRGARLRNANLREADLRGGALLDHKGGTSVSFQRSDLR